MPQDPSDNQAQLLAGVLDSSLDGIMAFRAVRDEAGEVVDFVFEVINRRSEHIVGHTASEMLGRRLLEFFPGNVEDGLFDAYVEVTNTGEPFITEHHYAHDGLNHWLRICATQYGDGFAVTFSDITEMIASNERMRVLFESSTDAHLLFDDNGIIDCNQAAIDMLGYECKGEVLNLHPAELSPEFQPDGRRSMEKCIEMDQRARDHGFHRFDWMHRRKDGSDIPVEVTLNPVTIAGKGALLVVWHDLTERIEAEGRIRETAERLAEAQTLAHIGSWQWTPADDVILWSDETKKIFGLRAEDPAPDFETHQKQIHPDDLAHWQSVVARAMEDHLPYTMQFRTVLPGGEVRVVEGRGRCELATDGSVARMYGTVQDITERERAAQDLQLAKERFDLMVAGNASGVWDWDCQTDTVYYSPRFEELLGYEPYGMEHTLDAFVSRLHPEDRDRIWEQVQRHLKEHTPYDVEYRLRHKDGHYVWCRAAGQAQFDEAGKPIRMAGSIADITGRIAREGALAESEQRLQFALEASHAGLWDWDVQTGSTYFSDSWYTMLGYEPGEMPMHVDSWVGITEPSDLKRAWAALDDYISGKTQRYACEIRVKTKDGQWRWVLDIGEAAERDASGAVTRMIGLHLDIHAQKTAQLELADARDIAQQASAAKSTFVANMSHEIRTPMNAILGYADLLLDADQTEADKRNHAQTIRRNGKHLMGILNDVLDISKIEAGKMSLEQVQCKPDQLFADVITLMMPRAIEKGIDLDFVAVDNLPPRIVTDPTRLRQVLLNLVGNAIKFTAEGSVTVRVSSEPQQDDSLRLICDVVDTGIGIEPDQLGRLFKPFNQADETTTRRFGGTGLGLAISHNLCEMLGGALTCQSTPGRGSTFTATVRVGQATSDPAQRAAPRPASIGGQDLLAGKRVLVVEDGKDNQRLIRHYLAKSGANVDTADNGEVGRDEALRAQAAGEPYDMILMDMQMPVLDGYGATRQLREAGYKPAIIALTAHASAQDREACLAAGCDDYLAKPVDRHKLVRLIASHLQAALQQGSGI